MAKDKIFHEGAAYYSVGATARMLSTSANKVRELMGNGNLDWTQLRTNGPLLIPAESIVAHKRKLVYQQAGGPTKLPAGRE